MYYKPFKFQLKYLKKTIFHHTKRFYRLHREILRRKKTEHKMAAKLNLSESKKNSSKKALRKSECILVKALLRYSGSSALQRIQP